jgi:peptide deformylase
MAIRTIVKDGNDFLRKKSREITVFDTRLHTLLDDMLETMHAANGVGLAAVQVGILRRALIVDLGEDLVELINPVILEASEETQNDPEGCLSFPGEYGLVERPLRVKVQAQDRHGDLIILEAEGLKARAFCHEIDHLNGVLFIDLATEMLDDNDVNTEPEE